MWRLCQCSYTHQSPASSDTPETPDTSSPSRSRPALLACVAIRSLMKDLERLIGDGQITARIDSQAKVLYAR